MKIMKNLGNTCLTETCDEAAQCRGLCHACYQWDYYHMTRRHGIAYMLKAASKNARIAARIKSRVGARRKLRSVAGGRR